MYSYDYYPLCLDCNRYLPAGHYRCSCTDTYTYEVPVATRSHRRTRRRHRSSSEYYTTSSSGYRIRIYI
jgi:hypothetical protein